MNRILVITLGLLSVLVNLSSVPSSHAVTGIDEVTSLRSKLHATIEHANLELSSEEPKAHWLLINDVPWKWDDSALLFSDSFVNTNYDYLNPEKGDQKVIEFNF